MQGVQPIANEPNTASIFSVDDGYLFMYHIMIACVYVRISIQTNIYYTKQQCPCVCVYLPVCNPHVFDTTVGLRPNSARICGLRMVRT